jgi:hypothetical protein
MSPTPNATRMPSKVPKRLTSRLFVGFISSSLAAPGFRRIEPVLATNLLTLIRRFGTIACACSQYRPTFALSFARKNQRLSQLSPITQFGGFMIVYVLTNPAMPGLVKIGKTSGVDADGRISQLYTTGVPLPFKIEFACRARNEGEVEKALHIAFGPQRINPKREFFRIDPEQVIAILKLLHSEEATAEVKAENAAIDAESAHAAETFRSRRPNLNFEEMCIPIGSVLESYDDDSTAVVVGPKKVRFRDAEMTLTAATRLMLGLDYSVAPGSHWTFQGRRISEIYEDTYPDE